MLQKWFFRWLFILLIATTQSYDIRVIYDDFFVNSVQTNWKESLELLFRQLALRNLANPTRIEKFHPRQEMLLGSGNNVGTVLLTSCEHSLWFNKRKGLNSRTFSLDLMPCERPSSNAVPLSWSQENWLCFYARLQKWMAQTELYTNPMLNKMTQTEEILVGLPKFCHSDYKKTRYTTVKRMLDSSKLHLKGNLIPVGILNNPPSSLVKTDANFTVTSFSGHNRNLTDLLFHFLQAKYTPIVPTDRSLGVYTNGSWNGLIGLMLKGDIAFASAPYYTTHDRYQAVDYSAVIYENVNTIIIRAPQEETKLWAAVNIYEWQVWSCLISSMVTFAGFMWFIFRFFKVKANDLVYHLLSFLRVMVNQGEEFPAKHLSTRVLQAVWCLAAVVLVNVYTSTLMSSLTVPNLRPAADSLEDVIYRTDLEPLAKSGTSWESLIMYSNLEAMKTLAQRIRKNPSKYWVESSKEGISGVLKGKNAFLSTKGMLQFEVVADFEAQQRCRLYITKHSINRVYLAGILPKNDPSSEAYNYAITVLGAHGWPQYWDLTSATDHKRGTQACLGSHNQAPSSKRLGLHDFISAFLVLAIGSTTATTFFVCENLRRKNSC